MWILGVWTETNIEMTEHSKRFFKLGPLSQESVPDDNSFV